MAFLYGRAGRLTAKNGGFRPGQSYNVYPMSSHCTPRVQNCAAYAFGAGVEAGSANACSNGQVLAQSGTCDVKCGSGYVSQGEVTISCAADATAGAAVSGAIASGVACVSLAGPPPGPPPIVKGSPIDPNRPPPDSFGCTCMEGWAGDVCEVPTSQRNLD